MLADNALCIFPLFPTYDEFQNTNQIALRFKGNPCNFFTPNFSNWITWSLYSNPPSIIKIFFGLLIIHTYHPNIRVHCGNIKITDKIKNELGRRLIRISADLINFCALIRNCQLHICFQLYPFGQMYQMR